MADQNPKFVAKNDNGFKCYEADGNFRRGVKTLRIAKSGREWVAFAFRENDVFGIKCGRYPSLTVAKTEVLGAIP